MRLFKTIPNWRTVPRAVLTIGVFDGVHRGHRPILAKVVREAARVKGTALALTFDGHPTQLVSPQYSPPLLATLGQKLQLLAEAGLDGVILQRFDRAFASTEAQTFVEKVLVGRLRIRHLVVGYDFVFGRQGLGGVELLKESSRRLGFGLSVVGPVHDGPAPVSSTRIRTAILAGDMATAARLLGRPWTVTGPVVKGDARGRTLGWPTANLKPEQELLPKQGVWGGRVRQEGKGPWVPFLANLGSRPTFAGKGAGVGLELHLLGFRGDLYGKRLEAEFQHWIRAERKFKDGAALAAQIGKDRQAFDRWRRMGRRAG